MKFCDIWQINLQHSRSATDELVSRLRVRHTKPDQSTIILVQEPFLNKGKVSGIDRSCKTMAFNDDPRAAIITYGLSNVWYVPKFSNRDVTTCVLESKGKMTYIVSAYLDINDNNINDKLVKIVEFCNANNHELIIGCDSNAHSSLWGCTSNNRRGDMVEEFIFENNLSVENVGNTYTFDSPIGKSIIDITLTNERASQVISKWHVDKSESFSDHKYVQFTFKEVIDNKVYYRNLKRTDWQTFQMLLWNVPTPANIDAVEDLEREAKRLVFEINSALEVSCPMKPNNTNKPGKSWWNKEIHDKRLEVRREYKRYVNDGKPSHHTYKEKVKAFKNMIKAAKAESWKEFCSNNTGPKDLSKVIRSVTKSRTPDIGLIKDKDGQFSSDPSETIDILCSTHFPGCIDETKEIIIPPMKVATTQEITDITGYITESKTWKALFSFNTDKAAGLDGIKPLVLRYLTPNIVSIITDIYKACLKLAYTPTCWREMKVIFLPKPGKDTYDEVKSYRPITLSSFLFKGLERIMLWFILETKLNDSLPRQHAFTKGKSTDTALSEAINVIEKSAMRGKYALGIFLDIEGAFDNLNFETIRMSLERCEVNNQFTNWYYFFLQNRELTVNLNGTERHKRPMRGTPQGGILSPIIWNICIDSLISELDNTSADVVGFADDILTIATGLDLNTVVSIAQNTINIATKWGVTNSLKFSPLKSCAIIFTNRQIKKLPELYMNGCVLKYVNETRYLGITLDKKLNYNSHISNIVKKGKSTLMALKSVIGNKWGLTPKNAFWAYTTMVRPMINYGSVVWGHKAEMNSDSLERLQRLACLLMTPVMKTTPTKGLEVIFNMLPLDLFCLQTGLTSWLRIRDQVKPLQWDGLTTYKDKYGHAKYWMKKLDECHAANMPSDALMTKERNLSDLNISTNPVQQEADFRCYTDGSKLDGRTGYGWAVTRGNFVIHDDFAYIGRETSVFQAEVIAIGEVCKWLATSDKIDPKSRVQIFSDSQSALMALKADEITSNCVKETIKEVKRLHDKMERVDLVWIKAHADNTGNEFADYLAKQGTLRQSYGPEPMVPVSKSTIKGHIQAYFKQIWNLRWKNEKTCRQTKIFISETGTEVTKGIINWNRTTINRMIQIITGHCVLNRHLCLLQIKDDPKCRLCNEADETPEHLVNDCPATWRERSEAFETPNETTTMLKRLKKFVCTNRLKQMLTHDPK